MSGFAERRRGYHAWVSHDPEETMTIEAKLDELSVEELAAVDGYEVGDPGGESVGFLDLVFADETTGRPEWLGVWTGIRGGRRAIAPIRARGTRGLSCESRSRRSWWTQPRPTGSTRARM